MKYSIALLILLFSLPTHACFVGYESNLNSSIIILFISLIICILAIFIRYLQKVKRLYIPIIILMLACIPFGLEMFNLYGECGYRLRRVSIWAIYTMSIVLLYEIVKLLKLKISAGNT